MSLFKRIIALGGAAVMTALCFTGCGNGDNKTEGGVKELSAYLYFSPTAYTDSMPIWKEAEKKTGIRLKSVVSTINSNESAAYSTMLAGDKLPDIIRSGHGNLRELASDGGLVPLDDYIEKCAPNIKKFFEACPEAEKVATMEDGHIYFIPGSLSGLDSDGSPSAGFFIRQDWLDKLGLSTPTTIEEYYNVLKAFKNNDPNGNGLKDEVPYFARGKNLKGLLQLFDTNDDTVLRENGTVEYGPMTEKYKTAMKELQKWYKEGLIDSEIFSRSNAREQLLGQNLGGSTVDWFSSTSKYNETYADAVHGLNFVAMLPPKNVSGEVKSMVGREKLHWYGWGISSSCDKKNYEDIVKYFDFWMSEEGQTLMSYGVKGLSYDEDGNGNKVWSDEAKAYADGIPNYLRSIGYAEIGTIGNLDSEKSAMNDIGRKGFEMYEGIIAPIFPTVAYTDEENDTINSCKTNIDTAVKEQQQKWIFGEADVDATWDSYISTLKKMGADELVKVYNDGYSRMYK